MALLAKSLKLIIKDFLENKHKNQGAYFAPWFDYLHIFLFNNLIKWPK